MTVDAEFARDVRHALALTPPQLPSRYLYDALGSALFDAICELPWYGITRAEARLLAAHRAAVFACIGGLATIVELGPGSGDKLRAFVEGRPAGDGPLAIHLIDTSASALATAARTLGEVDRLTVIAHQGSYEAGLGALQGVPRAPGRALALFLGSNVGNFDPPAAEAFLRSIRATLVAGDAFVLGADLVKPERELLLAYDDPLGVSAAFNRNLLVRINRELDGAFDINAFDHRVVWNAAQSRMEMYLVAREAQRVRIPGAGVDLELAAGEAIWTETSYKYEPQAILDLVERAGFRAVRQWIDDADRFALTLFTAT